MRSGPNLIKQISNGSNMSNARLKPILSRRRCSSSGKVQIDAKLSVPDENSISYGSISEGGTDESRPTIRNEGLENVAVDDDTEGYQ